jgi:hypothetical protein
MKKFTTLVFLLLTGLVSYTQTAEQESNDSFNSANYVTIDNVKTGNVSSFSDYDYFVSKLPTDGTQKIFVKATNTGVTSSWLLLTVYGGNQGQLASRYISGITSIAAGAIVYDTIILYGRGADSAFFRYSASNTFSYEFKYEITDAGTNDLESNNNFASATLFTQHEIKPGHIKFVENGVSDDYDLYRTKTLADGTLKVYVSAVNRTGFSGWLNLIQFGGNKGQISNRYISGTTAIPAGTIVYDTIIIYGRGVDSVFFQFSASAAFSYNLSYEILDISNGDMEPNGSISEALSIGPKEIKPGHIKYAGNGTTDEYDLYRSKTPDDGTLKVYVSATNRGGTSNWLNLALFGGNYGQIGNRYISGTTSIPAGAKVYDTITLFGRGVDSLFFQLSASGAFSYSLSYEIKDISNGDMEPNGSLSEALSFGSKDIQSGHIKYAANGIADDYDFYRTKTPADGTQKVYVSATNRAGTSGWLNFILAGGNHLQIINKYISGTTAIPAGTTVYDTITLNGRVVDSLFFQFSSSAAFSYTLSYEILGYTSLEKDKATPINSLHIFPNPTNGSFIIAFQGLVKKGFVELYTLSGKRIFSEPASFASEKKMNIKNLSPGIYIVKLFDGEKYFSQKISIE